MTGVGMRGGIRNERVRPEDEAMGNVSGSALLDAVVSSEAPELAVDDLELMEVDSTERLLALLARLLRSRLSVFAAERPALDPGSPPLVGLSRSKPNCSKERLKEVVLVGIDK